MDRSRTLVARLLVMSAVVPSAASALGVDGGAIFQILAVEDLGLSPTAIGTALGLGVLSIPVQLWATRLSLTVAPRNLRRFLATLAGGCWGLAVLVAVAEPGDPVGSVALVMTVLAEISVSVLFATSSQPLLSRLLTTRSRQHVNARGRALGGGVLVLVVLGFGSSGTAARVTILAMVGVAAVVALVLLRDLRMPETPPPDDSSPLPTSLPPPTVPLLVLAGLAAASSWPLFPVYAAEVLWPGVDLGVVGAVQTGAALAVAILWRSTDHDLLPRVSAATAVLVTATLGFVALPYVEGSGALGVLTLGLLGASVAARSVVLMAVIELLHRTLSDRTTVRALTLLDVVASTSLQAGLFLGGLLISWSVGTTWGPADPYQVYVLVVAAGVAAAVALVRRRARGSAPVL